MKDKSENDYIAHVLRDDNERWATPHLLSSHLEGTANVAEAFASKFNCGKWGHVLGWAHDAGKGRSEWQKYLIHKSGYDEEAHLEGKVGKIKHAIHGAKLAEKFFGKAIGRFSAYCIAGHHVGLPDWSSAEGAGQAALQFQIANTEDVDDIAFFIKNKLKTLKPDPPPWKFSEGLDISLWIRMLYSCLVDADFLDTESYMDIAKSNIRGGYLSIPEILKRFNRHIDDLEKKSDKTKVNLIRKDVRIKCKQMAKEPQGIFSLSVPTGGGKTLSSLAFALNHAITHHLDRVIYVIPYTSIIEQNADVFREAIGNDQVVEHHTNFNEGDSNPKSRLATENWDAPLVITTSVQFFESLFAAKPSRCRKLHNIVNSVVILDEAQLVPVDYLSPILETMQLLVDHYNVTIVISTATQPAFGERKVDEKKFNGLREIKEITGDIKEVKGLYDRLKRVHVKIPKKLDLQASWEEIAEELNQHKQVLCVVSDRASCRNLHAIMPEDTFHLSSLMCGQHRSEIIKKIKDKLNKKETVRVISTQLVEAGVDIDFPVVYRAIAGLDSIAQAAGRCNREGKMELGKVVVFIPPKKAPMGILRKGTETAINILSTKPQDPLDFSLFEDYFSELYWKANSLDTKEISNLLSPDHQDCCIFFREAANRFCIIDDTKQKTIIVPYGESEKLVKLLKKGGPERRLMRKLQRYTVNIYNEEFFQMYQRGAVEEIYPYIFILSSTSDYSEQTGLNISETSFKPDAYIF